MTEARILILGVALLATGCGGTRATAEPGGSDASPEVAAEPAASATAEADTGSEPSVADPAESPTAASTPGPVTEAGDAEAVDLASVSSTGPEGVLRIGLTETQRLWADGSIAVVDVRDTFSYGQSHIPGARSVPLPSLLNGVVPEIPRGAAIVTYCT